MVQKILEVQQSGTVETLYYKISEIGIPIILIKGQYPGRTLLITAGIHGSEYPGIEAAKRIKNKILPEELSGNIIILPCVNQKAFFERSTFINPADGKNLNRCFPGKREGTESEQIAYMLEKDFFSIADFYLDFHSGDLPEKLAKFVFIPSFGEKEIVQAAHAAADYLDLPFGVLSQSRSGAYNHACLKGLPSLLIERGCFGERTEEAINGFVEDTYQILRYLKMLSDKKIFSKDLRLLEKVHYMTSSFSGLWTPLHSVGDTVKKGETLGVIEDFFGNIIKEYRAEQDGEILYQITGLPISQGEHLIAYGY